MLLLRDIVSHGPEQTVCSTRLDLDSVLLLGHGENLPSTLSLELIAQAMAVHDGLRRQAERRPAASSGFLLGSRRFDLLCPTLPVGEQLRVVAEGEENATGSLVRFVGRVETLGGEVLARGDVTVLEHRQSLES